MREDIHTRPINWAWGVARPNNRSFWTNVSKSYIITLEEIRQYQDYLNWYELSSNYKFLPDDNFLEEFKDKIDWDAYTRYHGMSEKTYLRFRDRIDFTTWYCFARHGRMDDNEYLEKYHTEIKNWGRLIIYLNDLPIEFLERYHQLFDDYAWRRISFYFNLTEEFVREHREKLDREGLVHNKNVPIEWLNFFENN